MWVLLMSLLKQIRSTFEYFRGNNDQIRRTLDPEYAKRLNTPFEEREKPNMNTRQSSIAVVRRLFKVGRQLVERRLKTLRRLFHPLPAEVWSMLNNSDAYFSILLSTNIFFCSRSAENVLYYHRFSLNF